MNNKKSSPLANLSEIQSLLGSMLFMTLPELTEIVKSGDAPVIMAITASALIQSVNRGKADELLKLMDRIYGKVTERVETRDTTPRSRPAITKNITVIKRVVA